MSQDVSLEVLVEEEVALEGPNGCTLTEAWMLMEYRLEQQLDVRMV